MKKKITKALSVILAVVLTFTAAPLSGFVGLEFPSWLDMSINANADGGYHFESFWDNTEFGEYGENDDFSYCILSKENKTCVIIGYSGNDETVIIPSKIDEYNVIGLYGGMFYYRDNSNIKNIVISDSIEVVDNSSFAGLTLDNLTIGKSVSIIGKSAFVDCVINNISVSSDNEFFLTDDSGVLFNYNKTTLYKCPIISSAVNYMIPTTVSKICEEAFLYCTNLESIIIPDNALAISENAFCCCTNLASISLGDNITSIGGGAFWDTAYYNNSENWEDDVLYIGKYLIVADRDIRGNYFGDYYFGNYAVKYGTKLIADYAFGECDNIIGIVIPETVTKIGKYAFAYCESLESVNLSDNLTIIEEGLFSDSQNLTNVSLGDNLTSIGDMAFFRCNIVNIEIPDNVTTIGMWAFYLNPLESVSLGNGIKRIESGAFEYCDGIVDVYYNGTKYDWDNTIYFGECNESLLNANIHFVFDTYDLGEETYSFGNYTKCNCSNNGKGHCFGMSITSAGYFNDILDITKVDGNKADDVYGLSKNSTVQTPICYYQKIQGEYMDSAIVAGDKTLFDESKDIKSDWKEIIDYVENNKYDDKGSLQILYRKGSGGHAINFLRYEVVNGQERIYAYDNNCPEKETYFYMSSDGQVCQTPYSTFSGAIDCISLLDVYEYFEIAESFDAKRYIYGDSNSIEIGGAISYPMVCGNESYTMFEIPDGVNQVVIIPLVDNATFQYCDKEYSFGDIDGDTVGIFTLATDDNESMEDNFVITNTSFSIQIPSRTEIRNKDGIILHANVEGNAPAGSYVRWESSNGNFSTSADGSNLKIIAKNKGWTTFTAILCDADGNELARDSVEMYSKSGFFDKIGGFFRSLFGTTKIYEN